MAMLPDYNEDEFNFDELPTTSDAVEQAAVAPITPAARVPVAPAPAIPVAPRAAPPDPYAEKIAKREAALENALNVAANEKDPTRLTSGAPAWFKGGPPPEKNIFGNSLVSMAGGMMSKPLEVALANPNRSFGSKLQDAKQLGAVQGMAGLISGLLNRNADNYDRNLNAAAKEASMMRTIPGGSRASKQADAAKTLYEGALRESANADLRKLREHNMAVTDMMNSTDEKAVPQLAAARSVVAQIRASRGLPEIDLSGSSLNSLQKQYGTINQEIGADSREAVADANAQNRRGSIAAAGNEQRKNQAEKITQEAARDQAEFNDVGDSDFVLPGQVSGDSAVRKDLREAVANRKIMMDGVQRLKEIQTQLNQMQHGFLGSWDEWMGTLTGEEGKKAQALRDEGLAIQHDLTSQERTKARANMGVPQPWEHALTKAMYPAPGSPVAYLNPSMYDAMLKMLDKHSYAYIKSHGGGYKSHGDNPGTSYQAQPNLSEVAPVVSARPGSRGAPVPAADDLTLPPAVEAAVQAREAPVPPIPADAVKGSARSPATVKDAKALKAAGGPAAAPPAAPAPVSDPKQERIRATIKELESRPLTPEQKARLEALKAKLNAS